METISLYIHWPFCQSKCPYCDFNVHTSLSVDDDRWTKNLLLELDYFGKKLKKRTLISVFFGGGTPSLMKPSSIEKVLSKISNYWNINKDIEISLEANPINTELRLLQDFRSSGINRLSIGVQSLNNNALVFLGRQHDATEAIQTIKAAEKIFSNYSFDLIYALPNQSIKNWRRELNEALTLAGNHMSLYQLTIEKGTPFARRKIKLPNDNLCAQFYEETQDIMENKKMYAYEISNHSRLGSECIHNLNYWEGGDYFGIGPGAHGRFTINETFFSTYQTYDPNTWLKMVEAKGHGTAKCKNMGRKERSEELLMVGLRTRKGINFAKFHRLTQSSLKNLVNQDQLKLLIANGFLEETPKYLRATLSGRMRLNTILYQLLI